MAYDVFISYSSKDKTTADAVCGTLEKQGIRCWIAPRDVPPGKSWPAAIVHAIRNSKVFVLVFSDVSNKSKQVTSEVGEAFDNGIPIIPLRIDDVVPSQEMGYYIKTIHWLDAMTPPMERHLNKLTDSVAALLSVEKKEQIPVAEPLYEEPVKKRWSLPTWAIVLIVSAAVVILSGVGLWVFSYVGSISSPTTPQEVVYPTEVVHPTEVVSPTAVVTLENKVERQSDATFTPVVESDWRLVNFMIPNPQLWKEFGDNSYTAVGQRDVDAFVWSTEIYSGNLKVALDLQRPESKSDGCIILYGDGRGLSNGSLIFCVDWDGYFLEKHTIYHEGENFITYVFNDNDTDEVYHLIIEIKDDIASMDVNGERVFSTFFDTQEINHSGRIGLFKKWFIGEITFSNIQVENANFSKLVIETKQPSPTITSQSPTNQTNQVLLISNPDCPPPEITSTDEIIVRVRWGASTYELAESNADHFTFRFLLDGEELDDIRPYRKPAEEYSGFEKYGCGPDQSIWWVHWDVPIGKLTSGTHTIAVEHILNETISDGLDIYPAGSLGLLDTPFEVLP